MCVRMYMAGGQQISPENLLMAFYTSATEQEAIIAKAPKMRGKGKASGLLKGGSKMRGEEGGNRAGGNKVQRTEKGKGKKGAVNDIVAMLAGHGQDNNTLDSLFTAAGASAGGAEGDAPSAVSIVPDVDWMLSGAGVGRGLLSPNLDYLSSEAAASASVAALAPCAAPAPYAAPDASVPVKISNGAYAAADGDKACSGSGESGGLAAPVENASAASRANTSAWQDGGGGGDAAHGLGGGGSVEESSGSRGLDCVRGGGHRVEQSVDGDNLFPGAAAEAHDSDTWGVAAGPSNSDAVGGEEGAAAGGAGVGFEDIQGQEAPLSLSGVSVSISSLFPSLDVDDDSMAEAAQEFLRCVLVCACNVPRGFWCGFFGGCAIASL